MGRLLRLCLLLAAAGCASSPAGPAADEGVSLYDGKPLAHWIREVQDFSWDRRQGAIKALCSLGEEAVPPLVALLRDPRAQVRRFAAEALGEMCDDAASATAALATTLDDSNAEVRFTAIWALRKIARYTAGPPRALAALENAAEGDANDGNRRAAAEALKEIREIAAERAAEGR